MKKLTHVFEWARLRNASALAIVLVAGPSVLSAAESTNTNSAPAVVSEADKAWKELQKALRPPMPPAEWQGKAAVFAEEEKGARQLIKDFPKHEEGYQLLLSVASQSDGNKTRELAKEIAASQASQETKTAAQDLLRKMEAVGKPLPIKFT